MFSYFFSYIFACSSLLSFVVLLFVIIFVFVWLSSIVAVVFVRGSLLYVDYYVGWHAGV